MVPPHDAPPADTDTTSVAADQHAFELGWAHVRARAAGEVEGVFGPDSASWKVHRETVIILGGIRALLLELAHPAVASAVARHSTFAMHYARRVVRTFGIPYQLIFGDLATAREAAAKIHTRHHPILGAIDPADASDERKVYRANDPALLFWVHATLVDSSLRTYESVFGPMATAERTRFYDESRTYTAMLGIPEEHVPPTLDAFEAYMQSMLTGPTLRAGPTAARLWNALRAPPMPLQTITRASALLSTAMLPPHLREGFGLPWNSADQRDHARLLARLQRTLPRLPGALRFNMVYHHALGRIAQSRGQRLHVEARVARVLGRAVARYL